MAADVRLRGLKELDKALGKADKNLRKNLRDKLKGVADIVAQEAKSIASAKTKKRTGNLVRGIKPYSLAGRAGVRSSAVHRGYAYPNRLEYEGRKGRAWGPLASVNPALDSRLDDLNKATEQVLSELEHDFEGRRL